MSLDCILIAAGGTGGHIYPALAIAQAIVKREPTCKIYFVGTAHGLENKIVPKAGFPVLHIPIGRLNSNVSVVERVMTLAKLPFAFLKSIWLLATFRPKFVLGVGGHASGPLLLMASLLHKRTAIWEPNAMPGLANRWLSRFVDECFLVFDESEKFLQARRVVKCGLPVRSEIEKVPTLRRLDDSSRFHIFSFGGSQGARGVNTAVAEMLIGGGSWNDSIQVLQQTGTVDFARLNTLYGDLLPKLPVEMKEYIYDMDQRYVWADLVIARAGTGTLSELAAAGKPSILIPLPTAADNHQQKNAEEFVKLGAAVMILQKDLNGVGLREVIRGLQSDPARLKAMGENARKFHREGAAESIVNRIFERV